MGKAGEESFSSSVPACHQSCSLMGPGCVPLVSLPTAARRMKPIDLWALSSAVWLASLLLGPHSHTVRTGSAGELCWYLGAVLSCPCHQPHPLSSWDGLLPRPWATHRVASPQSQWLWQEDPAHHCPALAPAAQWCHPLTLQSSRVGPGEAMEVFG